jgi:hypothetical protein
MEKYDQTKEEKINILKKQYSNLLGEQVKLNKVYQTLNDYNREYENTSISVQQQHLSLRMWLIISLLFIFVSYIMLSGGNPGKLGTIAFLIIIIFIGFTVYRYIQYN